MSAEARVSEPKVGEGSASRGLGPFLISALDARRPRVARQRVRPLRGRPKVRICRRGSCTSIWTPFTHPSNSSTIPSCAARLSLWAAANAGWSARPPTRPASSACIRPCPSARPGVCARTPSFSCPACGAMWKWPTWSGGCCTSSPPWWKRPPSTRPIWTPPAWNGCSDLSRIWGCASRRRCARPRAA